MLVRLETSTLSVAFSDWNLVFSDWSVVTCWCKLEFSALSAVISDKDGLGSGCLALPDWSVVVVILAMASCSCRAATCFCSSEYVGMTGLGTVAVAAEARSTGEERV